MPGDRIPASAIYHPIFGHNSSKTLSFLLAYLWGEAHGVALHRQERLPEALELFFELLDERPNSIGALVQIASIYLELDQSFLALDFSQRAVQLCPYSELGSLILHHSLLDVGAKRRAYEEMARFFSHPQAKPVLYPQYLSDLADSLDIEIQNIDGKEFPNQGDLLSTVMVELQQIGELGDEPSRN